MLIEHIVTAYYMPSLVLGTVLNDSSATSVDVKKIFFLNCVALKYRINSKTHF